MLRKEVNQLTQRFTSLGQAVPRAHSTGPLPNTADLGVRPRTIQPPTKRRHTESSSFMRNMRCASEPQQGSTNTTTHGPALARSQGLACVGAGWGRSVHNPTQDRRMDERSSAQPALRTHESELMQGRRKASRPGTTHRGGDPTKSGRSGALRWHPAASVTKILNSHTDL